MKRDKLSERLMGVGLIFREAWRFVIHPFQDPFAPPIPFSLLKSNVREIYCRYISLTPLISMELSSGSIGLLRFIVSFDGKEVGGSPAFGQENKQGQEVDAPRRLNGEESAQRRFFNKEADRIQKEISEVIQPIVDAHNAKSKAKRDALKPANPKDEGENEDAYEARLAQIVGKDEELRASFMDLQEKNKVALEKKHQLNLTEKTVAFLKKYYLEFSGKVGFLQGDDDMVEELNGAFGL